MAWLSSDTSLPTSACHTFWTASWLKDPPMQAQSCSSVSSAGSLSRTQARRSRIDSLREHARTHRTGNTQAGTALQSLVYTGVERTPANTR